MRKLSLLSALIFIANSQAFASGEGEALLTCSSWGASIEVEADGNDTYVATISGTAATHIIEQEGQSVIAIGGGYDDGRTWETTKERPLSFDIVTEDGGEKVVIRALRKLTYGGFGSGQYQPQISPEAGGYKLRIDFSRMTGSHSTLYYEYANWFFDECSAQR